MPDCGQRTDPLEGISRPAEAYQRRTAVLARIAACVVLMAVGTRVGTIPFYPAPITLQTLFLAVDGLLLGPWRGLIAVSLYLLMGLLGLPVFAAGGGPGYIFHPNFGFLLGFLPAVVLIGLGRRLDRCLPRIPAYTAAALLGLIAVYLVGIPYYSLIKGLYGQAPAWVILSPFFVYLPGDLIKAVIAAVLAARLNQTAPQEPPSE